jgi:hypothetical protein
MNARWKLPCHATSSGILRLVAVAVLCVVVALASCTSDPVDADPDPVDAFLERMGDEHLTARAVVDGTMTVGDAEFPLDGGMTVAGPDSQTDIRVALPAGELRNEQIEVDGMVFVRENGGPWFANEGVPDGGAEGDENIAAWVRSVSSVTNQGRERHEGSSVYRLVPDEPLDAATLGLDQDIEDGRMDVAFLVSVDGTLQVMEVRIDGTVEGQPFRMRMDLRFGYPAGVEVDVPDDVWVRYASTRHGYSIGHPEGWEVAPRPQLDALFPTTGAESVGVYENHLPPDLTFEEAARMLLRLAERSFRGELGDVTPIPLASGGAVLASTRGRDGNGAAMHYQIAIVGSGRALYELFWSSPTGNESSDRATFEQMVRSFRVEA